CMGSVTELLDDLEIMTESEVVQLFAWRKAGLERLRRRLGDTRIGYMEQGSYELLGENETGCLDKLDYLNQLLLPVAGKPAFERANGMLETFGFSKGHVSGLIRNTCEGGLHSGMMLRALADLTISSGIEIKTGAEVVRYTEEEQRVSVEVKDPFRDEAICFLSGSLVLCTNAFTKALMPEEEIRPGRGQVIITEPVDNLNFKGIFHFDKGYYYFRELDGRVLIGGGRNLDFEGETTLSFELSDRIQQDLEAKLRDVILPGRQFKTAQRWAGIMGFGPTKYPVVKAFSSRVFGAFRMGGMGVALGSNVAIQVADLVYGKQGG
ncbi:MAG: FAD-binding oxidoreductase, partial [Sphingobacteriales bacterium]